MDYMGVNSAGIIRDTGVNEEEAGCRAEEAFSCRRWLGIAGANRQLDEKEAGR